MEVYTDSNILQSEGYIIILRGKAKFLIEQRIPQNLSVFELYGLLTCHLFVSYCISTIQLKTNFVAANNTYRNYRFLLPIIESEVNRLITNPLYDFYHHLI